MTASGRVSCRYKTFPRSCQLHLDHPWLPHDHMCTQKGLCKSPVEKIEIQVVRDSLQEPLLSMCTSHCLDSLEDILDLRYYHLYLSVYNRLLGSHSQLKSVQMQCRVEWKSITVGETLQTIHSFSFFFALILHRRSKFTDPILTAVVPLRNNCSLIISFLELFGNDCLGDFSSINWPACKIPIIP